MTAPLEGVRVVEFGHVMAGPVCGRLLADLGAGVVKIEPPGGDPSRTFVSSDPGSESAAFAMLNRNKRGIAVDLKQTAGVDVVRRLLARADVVIENFRPGVMESFGLGYDGLRETNPRLVYCRITGFGTTGPMASLGGFDLIAQGLTGLLSITGDGPDGPPTKCGPPVTDITAGILGALGVVAALHARERTGEGQCVETSLYAAGAFQTLWHSAIAMATGVDPKPLGSAHPLAAPYEAFQTSDGWITVGGSNQGSWLRLVGAIERPELAADPRFRTNGDRMSNLDALRRVLGNRFGAETTEHWLAKLRDAGVPAGAVSTVSEMLSHPQTRAVEMVTEVADGGVTLGIPLHFNGAPRGRPSRAPGLGADTDEVLLECGLDTEEIEVLRRSRVLI